MPTQVPVQAAIDLHQRKHDETVDALRNAISHMRVFLADVDLNACDNGDVLRIVRHLEEHNAHIERLSRDTHMSRGVLRALREVK